MNENIIKRERNRIKIDRETYKNYMGVQFILDNYETALDEIEKLQSGLIAARKQAEEGAWFSRDEVSELLDLI